MKKKWKRKCPNPDNNPNCKEELCYTEKYNRDNAEKRNTNCGSCSKKGENNPSKRPEVRKKISESMSGENNPNYGKPRPKEIRKKIGDANRGKIRESVTEETRKRMSESHEGKKHSEETKRKQRLSAIKIIEKNKLNGGQLTPNYNHEACKKIDEYNKKHNYNFQHAENGGERCIDGYFPDGVDEKRKTIIEIDEKHHYKNGKLNEKDVKRQQYFESLGYKVIRIKI